MRTLSILRIGLFLALLALLSRVATAQDATGYFPADPVLPVPLSNDPSKGGFYISAEFVMFRQTNPLTSQLVAKRGFEDVDGSITAALTGVGKPGTFYGSGASALDVHQVSGPNDFQPGTTLGLGYKFDDGSSIVVNWMYLTQHRTLASATPVPFNFNIGPDGANSYLFSPVYGFPPDYAGQFGSNANNAIKIPNSTGTASLGNPLAAYGIWNAANVETITFLQRTQDYEVTWREPVYETENYRISSLVGGRFFWIWESFTWRTVDVDTLGNGGPLDTAIYSNIESNRMYGPHAGISQECYLGHGFACQLDLDAAMFLDVIREKAQYTTGAKYGIPQVTAESKRTITAYQPVPEIAGNINLVWYPIQSVQVRIGYNAMAFFNTISSPQPIDFNYGALTPEYKSTFRLFDGINVGLGIIW